MGGRAYGNDVDESHDRGQDTRGNDKTPEGKTQVLNAGCIFVEMTQDVETENNHWESERDEARLCAEQGPIFDKVGLEEVEFGDNEEETNCIGDEVRNTVKEEELEMMLVLNNSTERSTYAWGFDCHDKHNPTCCHHCEESNDVENPNDIQDDVSLASPVFSAEAEHFDGVLKSWCLGKECSWNSTGLQLKIGVRDRKIEEIIEKSMERVVRRLKYKYTKCSYWESDLIVLGYNERSESKLIVGIDDGDNGKDIWITR